jgi:hypothetical protein
MSYLLSRGQELFAKVETSFAVPTIPVAGDAIKHEDIAITSSTERLENKARQSGRSAQAPIENRRSGEFKYSGGFTPSGTAGVDPAQNVLLACVLTKTDKDTTTAIEASPAPSVNGCTVSTAAAATVGDLIAIPVGDVYEVVRVATKNTAAITWTPALSSAPVAATAVIQARIKYALTDKPTGSFTLLRNIDDGKVEVAVGCVSNTIEMAFGGGEYGTLSVSGPCADVAEIGIMTFEEDLDDTETSWEVVSADAMVYPESTARAWGIVDEEIVAVTAVNRTTDVLTVTRAQGGTSAAVHNNLSGTYDTIYPYAPTPSYNAQEPVAGIIGKISLDNGDFEVESLKVSDSENLELLDKVFGHCHATAYIAPAIREVTFDITGYFKSDDATWAKAAHTETVALLFQAGTQSGKIVAGYAPALLLDIPAIECPAGEKVPLTLKGKALQSAAANDEFELWLL